MNTTHKPQRNSIGDYIYKDEYIMRGEMNSSWIITIRGNNGHNRYKRFKTLKQACAFIDNQAN
jgi:3-deoxy-D-arabino-heptulosonate 7-phosphate (DAHP) synthase